MRVPQATYPFIEFPAILRQHGFSIAPDQTIGFIEAIGLLGPRHMGDIHAAGLSLLAIPHEREAEYDALFSAYFMGSSLSAPAEGDEDQDLEIHEPEGRQREIEATEEEQQSGTEATGTEQLVHRQFSERDEDIALIEFRRQAPDRLPRRRSYRRARSRHGDRLDMRQALREAVQRDGEVFTLPETRRRTRQRRIVVLIDVSGSMEDRTESLLRFAHALVQSADRIEVFTLGTRLTRITAALRITQPDRALARVSAVVADFDGGTRIGDALEAFLSVPRFAGFSRGAAVIVLSDGLERGDPALMIHSVQRLARLSWRLDWLTPLAGDEGFSPRTEALAAVRPWLDSLADGSQISAITSHVLKLARAS